MNQNVLAAQLYTVRDFTKTLQDFTDTVAKISAIGYTAAQVSAIGPIAPEDVKKICDDNGITIVNTHIGWERLKDDISAVIDEHSLWDCRHVAVGSMPRHFIEAGEEGLRQFIVEANQVGQTLHEAGLTFSYHNHSFEFMRYGDKNGLEILFEETDPRYVQAELDTFWIQFGGGDVCDWILRLKDRMPVVHFKDMAMVGWREQVMKEVGEGNLNWPGILDACRQANVEWYAVEQDICPGDPFESLAISYRNLVQMGLS